MAVSISGYFRGSDFSGEHFSSIFSAALVMLSTACYVACMSPGEPVLTHNVISSVYIMCPIFPITCMALCTLSIAGLKSVGESTKPCEIPCSECCNFFDLISPRCNVYARFFRILRAQMYMRCPKPVFLHAPRYQKPS